MTDSPDPPARLVRMSTLCPLCSEVCTWYRLPDLLFAICPIHGRVEQMPVTEIQPPPKEP